jgi:hypothetical protein
VRRKKNKECHAKPRQRQPQPSNPRKVNQSQAPSVTAHSQEAQPSRQRTDLALLGRRGEQEENFVEWSNGAVKHLRVPAQQHLLGRGEIRSARPSRQKNNDNKNNNTNSKQEEQQEHDEGRRCKDSTFSL